jgi:hypothetical protein
MYAIPSDLRPMILEYFHDSVFGAHLGDTKTLQKIFKAFYWPGLKPDMLKYVRKCARRQQAKPAQIAQVGLNQSHVVTKPMERIFSYFVGLTVRSRKENVTIFAILDGLSKFVAM